MSPGLWCGPRVGIRVAGAARVRVSGPGATTGIEMGRDPGKPATRWTRHAGMGIELAGAVVGFCLLGIWIDRRYDTSPYGTLVCALLGLVGGMYNFIRQSLREVRRQ